jgi:esterase/lipase
VISLADFAKSANDTKLIKQRFMRILYALMLSLIATNSFCQKKAIDIAACRNWERLEEINGKSCLLSADGNYALFRIHSENKVSTTILKNLKTGAEKMLPVSNENSFDHDRMFSFQLPGDTLAILNTGKDTYTYLPAMKSYFIIRSGAGDKIGYFSDQAGKKSLTIWGDREGRILEIPDADPNQYWLNNEGTAILTKSAEGLTYTELRSLKQIMVKTDGPVESAAFNRSGTEIAYISKPANGYELSHFDFSTGNGSVLINDSSGYLKNKWKLAPEGLSFGNDDSNIFFKISPADQNNDQQKAEVITRDIDVWSYRDLYLQQKQLSELRQKPAFIAMIKVKSRKIVQLESGDLSLQLSGNTSKYFVLTTSVNSNEFYWNKQKMSMFLFSSRTGEKKLIKESHYPSFQVIGISPDNKFLVWFDGADGNYYSYDISNSKISNISRSVDPSFRILNKKDGTIKSTSNPIPNFGQYWISNGAGLLVHSRYDVWLLDPSGTKAPVNLTNGYGTSHDTRFKLVTQDDAPVKFNSKEFLVTAFDEQSKQNGFWKISASINADPIKLVMSDDAYFFTPNETIVSSNSAEDPGAFKPVKALNKDIFVVRRMNSLNAPNLYYTSDFKNFKQISNIVPNKDYVRIKTKLIRYTLPDGTQAEGILHTPDNLDATKKYPLIFNYYEQRSECLNVCRTPELSGHNINIPWYVSRDYLVFEPDFYYKRGETAQSIINAVASAIKSLNKLPYVDTPRMGAQGQSFGGYETNVLAIQTSFFKAACEMAGPTDIISEYGSIRPGGFNNESSADKGQRNLRVYPWEHPEVFIKNSPVFHIGKAKTPLLIVHNKEDDAILFSQAMELYLGMRRLHKPVWMLQYDKEGHDLTDDKNKLDFTTRMQQFFDHYLKGVPPPAWMTQGIPAKDKGNKSGLDLDPGGKCSDTCPVCNPGPTINKTSTESK